MPKTIYEGYRIGKDGGERWVGTVQRNPKSGDFETRKGGEATKIREARSTPKGGSALTSSKKR